MKTNLPSRIFVNNKTMAPRRKTIGSSDDQDTGDDDYRKKRERNNQAVKRCREKAKKTAEETQKRIDNLRDVNIQLEAVIRELKRSSYFLKSVLLEGDGSEEQKNAVKKIFGDEND